MMETRDNPCPGRISPDLLNSYGRARTLPYAYDTARVAQASATPCHGCGQTPPVRGDAPFASAPHGCGGRDGSLLETIRALDFSLYETALYLDAYPHDGRALELFHRLEKQRKEAVAAYEEKVGPLTFSGNRSTTRWEWVETPFPWELPANT